MLDETKSGGYREFQKKKTSDQGAAAGGAKRSARRCCQTKTIYADLQHVTKKSHESRMTGTADDKLASSFSQQKKTSNRIDGTAEQAVERSQKEVNTNLSAQKQRWQNKSQSMKR